jgi:hypothetical protein
VKYGGAVGKKSVIAVVALIVIGIAFPVAGWMGLKEAIYAALALVVLIFFGAMKSIDSTLEKHPELALMDGMEIVAYKKVEMAAKNLPSIAETPRIADPNPPLLRLAGSDMEDG